MVRVRVWRGRGVQPCHHLRGLHAAAPILPAAGGRRGARHLPRHQVRAWRYLASNIYNIYNIYSASRLKEGLILEPQRSQVLVSLAVTGSYFIFYLLYFILMTVRQVEFLVDMSQMHRMLGKDYFYTIKKVLYLPLLVSGMSVMFITRPLFVLIGHVWHIAVPLATLTLDRELRTQWPAHLLLPARLRGAGAELENSIVMEDVGGEAARTTNNNEAGPGKTEVSSTFSVMMLENREFHNNYNVH